MTTKMLEEQWTADPTQPGRVNAGDAIQIEVRVAFWRAANWDKAERLAKEAEALVLAAPVMAKALRRIWNAHHGQDGAEEMEQVLLEVEGILSGAGVPLP